MGHSVSRLLGELEARGIALDQNVLSAARTLDRHYIPARYPNAHVGGPPFEFYDVSTSREAIKGAERIIEFIRDAAKKWTK